MVLECHTHTQNHFLAIPPVIISNTRITTALALRLQQSLINCLSFVLVVGA